MKRTILFAVMGTILFATSCTESSQPAETAATATEQTEEAEDLTSDRHICALKGEVASCDKSPGSMLYLLSSAKTFDDFGAINDINGSSYEDQGTSLTRDAQGRIAKVTYLKGDATICETYTYDDQASS